MLDKPTVEVTQSKVEQKQEKIKEKKSKGKSKGSTQVVTEELCDALNIMNTLQLAKEAISKYLLKIFQN